MAKILCEPLTNTNQRGPNKAETDKTKGSSLMARSEALASLPHGPRMEITH